MALRDKLHEKIAQCNSAFRLSLIVGQEFIAFELTFFFI